MEGHATSIPGAVAWRGAFVCQMLNPLSRGLLKFPVVHCSLIRYAIFLQLVYFIRCFVFFSPVLQY
jgi:hypothetical protein